jgi:hypothetical protein
MYKVKCTRCLRERKRATMPNQGKCAKILKAKCAKELKAKCAKGAQGKVCKDASAKRLP